VRYWVFGIVDLVRNRSALGVEGEGIVKKLRVREIEPVRRVLQVFLRWWPCGDVMDTG